MASGILWAPWRMEYIRSPKPGGCIFCDFLAAGPAHHREHLILCERPAAFVMLNRYPFAAGHLMVVPRRHVADPVDLPADEYVALMDLVRDATAALRAASKADGINVGLNLGHAAGAGIAGHLHVHVVPRWYGDLNFMPVVGDVTVIPEALDATLMRLQPYFAPLSRSGADSTSSTGVCAEGGAPSTRATSGASVRKRRRSTR